MRASPPDVPWSPARPPASAGRRRCASRPRARRSPASTGTRPDSRRSRRSSRSAPAAGCCTRSLAVSQASAGLRANCVAPGPIATPIAAQYVPPQGADPALINALILPFGEIGQAEQVAAVIAWLASDDASHVNGEIVRVDGGKRA